MTGTLAFTGVTGPSGAITKTFPNVNKLTVDLQAVTVTVEWTDPSQGPTVTTLDYNDIDTLSASVVEAVSTAFTITT